MNGTNVWCNIVCAAGTMASAAWGVTAPIITVKRGLALSSDVDEGSRFLLRLSVQRHPESIRSEA